MEVEDDNNKYEGETTFKKEEGMMMEDAHYEYMRIE